MYSTGKLIVKEIESASDKLSPLEILQELRRLSLDDFGSLLISLPNAEFPRISDKLPAMANSDTQKSWTGSDGFTLLRQTLAFTKQIEVNAVRYLNKPLQGSNVLDFGCGYGRFIRMLYYYTNPSNIWGVDAWDRSLEKCKEVGLLGNFALSDSLPEHLPVAGNKFDIAFSFSVFTHLSPKSVTACLGAVRHSMNDGGLFMATVRPVEFWQFMDKMRNTNHAERLEGEHKEHGFAYLPHAGAEGEFYGDLSCSPEYLEQIGWSLIGYDTTILDNYQVTALLRAV